MVSDSILISIKDILGIDKNYDAFDSSIIMHINSALMSLNQLGYPSFRITGKDELWDDYLESFKDFEGVKTYIFFKVQSAFDPPQTGPLFEAVERQIKELEFRLILQCETA